jgi:YidC/Oxa1 family membrane protein insertase
VETDVLDIKIRLKGGDVVYAALPKYKANIDTPNVPFVLLEENNRRTVYIAQSALIGLDKGDVRADFSTASNHYKLAQDQDSLTVDLTTTNEQGVEFTKRFTFTRGEYLVKVEYLVNNHSDANWSGQLFAQLKRDNNPDPGTEATAMGMQPFLGIATRTAEEPYIKTRFDDLAEDKFSASVTAGWISIVQHYFISAWIPEPTGSYQYSTNTTEDFNFIRFKGQVLSLKPGESGSVEAGLYVGPKDQYRLEKIAPGLELTVDYGILWWIAQPLFWLLTKIHGVLGNWGFAIIGVTVLVKAAFFQLNAKAYRSMANMRKVQPKLVALRERYADDKQKQSQEMMNLYKKEKINPLGGCLPILVQMPVFISLYWVLMESVELRHAPFILWIHDLSVMDPYFVLPLIMGVSMFFQQKLNPPPPDPMQAKIMQWMPVMFTFFFLFFPAGLVLYWVVNNVLSIAQQYVITKKIENA